MRRGGARIKFVRVDLAGRIILAWKVVPQPVTVGRGTLDLSSLGVSTDREPH